jgi:hypothetical protein
MSKTNRLAAVGALVLLLAGLNAVNAQNNNNNNNPGNGGQRGNRRQRSGNFDPAQFQQRIADRYRERLEITDDAEWKAIQPRIQKVLEARMAIETGRRGTFDRGNRPGGDRNRSDQNQRGGTTTTNSNPAAETLQRAINEKASNADLKTAAAQYMAARKARQADLEKAQEELRMVLTQRQESIALLAGLL